MAEYMLKEKSLVESQLSVLSNWWCGLPGEATPETEQAGEQGKAH